MGVYVKSRRLLVLTPPRCASTYLRAMLAQGVGEDAVVVRPVGVTEQHPPAVRCLRWLHCWRYSVDRVICPVRERESWLRSYWRLQDATAWKEWEPGLWHPCRLLQAMPRGTENAFVAAVERRCPGFHQWLFDVVYGLPNVAVERVPYDEAPLYVCGAVGLPGPTVLPEAARNSQRKDVE